MRRFKHKKSPVKRAIKKNELDEMNCCYTLAGHYNNQAEAERAVLDKMGPSNQPRGSILTLAAKSVISKRDREIMQEEGKLLEKYYQDYYKESSRSRGSSTKSRKKEGQEGRYLAPSVSGCCVIGLEIFRASAKYG